MNEYFKYNLIEKFEEIKGGSSKLLNLFKNNNTKKFLLDFKDDISKKPKNKTKISKNF